MRTQTVVTFAAFLASVNGVAAGTLWVAPPYSGVVYRLEETGTILDTIAASQVFGVASSGQHIYFSRSTAIEKRSADGRQLLSSWPQDVQYGTYDLAWDWTRNRLWALHIGKRELRQHHPETGVVERTIPLPSADPDGVLSRLTPLGLAYDPVRDRLYVSFCPAPSAGDYCTEAPQGRPGGLILSWDARSGLQYGTLFRTQGLTFGVAHSARNDTLWVVTRGTSQGLGYATAEYKLDGTYLREVRPDPFNYAHGLDYVPDAPAVVSTGLGAVQPTMGRCSGEFQFRGWITVIGAGTVRYHFVRSDGSHTPESSLQFPGAGTLPVQTSLPLSGRQEAWVNIKILWPNSFLSNPARVLLTCP